MPVAEQCENGLSQATGPSSGGRGGRPSKLTASIRDRIVQATAAGNYRHVAAAAACIGTTTLYRWLERGEADADRGTAPEFRK